MGRFPLGSILGTKIILDPSFLILTALFVVSYADSWGMPHALLWAPVLFIGILAHELAHAAAIGAFGFGPSVIVLGGMGGVTVNERRAHPWQDMIISAAGPLSSFLLAGVGVLAPATRDPMLRAFVPLFAAANLLWAKFNLLPVGPLDGAGILRNFLSLFLAPKTAFVISVWVSVAAGIAVAIYGIVTRYYLLSLLMAWYVASSYRQWQLYRSIE
jgi:stage IV sporulation protein FB